MSKTISAGRNPKILIERVGGDLSLVGWEGEDILLKGDDDQMTVRQDGETTTISCEDDLSLRVPKNAAATIERVEGDAAIRGVWGGVHLNDVEGDLSVRDVNSISVETAHSDLSLRSVKGDARVKTALSDVSIREVAGNLTLESAADDLALRDAHGNVFANVGGDVVWYLDPQPGGVYSMTAGDDVLLVTPPRANATLTLNADEIEVEWEGIERNDGSSSRVITLGDGSASVTVNAGGDIRVTNQPNAGEFAEDFGNFAGIGLDWSGFGERISRRVEEAARRATQRAEEATRRAERAARRVDAKVNLQMGRWKWDLTPKPEASNEERLAILKMLQEKKITAEEAETLLAALEGE